MMEITSVPCPECGNQASEDRDYSTGDITLECPSCGYLFNGQINDEDYDDIQKHILSMFGHPVIQYKDTVLRFARCGTEDIDDIRTMANQTLLNKYEEYAITLALGSVSLRDIQYTDLLRHEIYKRKLDDSMQEQWFTICANIGKAEMESYKKGTV